MSHGVESEPTEAIVKRILRNDLKLGDAVQITDGMPLFGGELDLDSLDALLLVASLEKQFGIKIPNEAIGRQVFQSVRTISDYIEQQGGVAGNVAGDRDARGAADLDALLSRLPHGEAFRFVSRLSRITPGVEGQGVWEVTGREPFFEGHFPGRPIVPGVLMAESLAQLSGLVAASAGDSSDATSRAGALVHVDVRFLSPVTPPASITLNCRQSRVHGSMYHFEVEAAARGQTVAAGTLVLAISGARVTGESSVA